MGVFHNDMGIREKWQTFLEIDSPEPTKEDYYIRLVNSLLKGALEAGASDIHIEPYKESAYRIRLRKDGVMVSYMRLNAEDYVGVTGRLRVLAKMDISDSGKPDDGSFAKEIAGHFISFRVSQMPTVRGLKLVLRILDERRFGKSLEALGIGGTDCHKLRQMLSEKSGLILVAGATGSGKTTTLYSLLKELDKERLNIVTIEDPVEYLIDGISQTEVSRSQRIDFSKGLRALLRQDPDVILIGEIRDELTASTAIRAAMTGHLVLSTIHTEDAPSAIVRLKNMGIQPYMISAGLRGVLAQRLFRKKCPVCRQKRALEKGTAVKSFEGAKETGNDASSVCPLCRGQKTIGRKAYFELLECSEAIKKACFSETIDLYQLALKEGMQPMSEQIRAAVSANEIEIEEGLTIDEVGR